MDKLIYWFEVVLRFSIRLRLLTHFIIPPYAFINQEQTFEQDSLHYYFYRAIVQAVSTSWATIYFSAHGTGAESIKELSVDNINYIMFNNYCY